MKVQNTITLKFGQQTNIEILVLIFVVIKIMKVVKLLRKREGEKIKTETTLVLHFPC